MILFKFGACMVALMSSAAFAQDGATQDGAADGAVWLELEGMTCAGCEKHVQEALGGLPFVSAVKASSANGTACAELSATADEATVRNAIADLGFTVTKLEPRDACPSTREKYPTNWSNADGLDVQIISKGEQVDLRAHRVPDKFTVFDFGAPWCGPCIAAEQLLKGYLTLHDDVAIRAIVLDRQNAKESYELPVVKQHLSYVEGIPYFVVEAPSGKVIYRGNDVVKVLKKIDRKRR